ncbi:uncharacterized protein LOC133035946 [Cannabis sativa]|uniref:uncharacterized protein LOC133035946 n=1 Tax=Cannabis sativa TaxID=3483 RepID=UPI0029CA8E46|nr:uncharacterized protein LOC133035946 [Cannabis sativa]
MPQQQQQQQQQQPRSPQQPQFFQQQQQHSPNMSGGSSQSPQLHYMFGLPSQSPPIFFSEAAGGSQTQPMVGNIGGSSQQPYPVYGQFGSLLQQQPVYGQMGGSPQQPMYEAFSVLRVSNNSNNQFWFAPTLDNMWRSCLRRRLDNLITLPRRLNPVRILMVQDLAQMQTNF